MNLQELEQKCKELEIPYAFGKFKSKVVPPHLVGTVIDTDNFSADNTVYHKKTNFRLELTTLKKDLELQSKIENELLKNTFWNKSEGQIENEDIYNTSYFFEIKEEKSNE